MCFDHLPGLADAGRIGRGRGPFLECLRHDLAVLAQQQTALRRVATLVARGGQPSEVFSAVAGELARIRSAFYYIAAGGVATAVMPIIMYYRERELSSYTAEYFAIIATAGFVGGLVYWLIAGRNA